MPAHKRERAHFFKCPSCSSRFKPSQTYTCPHCGDLVHIEYDYCLVKGKFASALAEPGQISVWRYADLLPVSRANAVTIGEGGTGLPRSKRLAQRIHVRDLFFKNEGQNPTGSFKDRGMTVAITRAVEIGSKSVLCASTGNTSASMAAYAAKAGLKAQVLIPKGKIAKGKLLQAIVHGARITEVDGNFDRALEKARRIAEKKNSVYLANSVNPYRIEGQKTVAFEIWEQLGRKIPDCVFVPVGNAGNISAIWKGFKELTRLKIASKTPRMIGVQASGAAPIATAYAIGAEGVIFWKHPETSASAIRIGAPARWKGALAAVRESKGEMLAVTDGNIARAQRLLANHEGIFAEPASAASVAGLIKSRKLRLMAADNQVVCIITGHGLKDQKAVVS
jgi:threonine synthase